MCVIERKMQESESWLVVRSEKSITVRISGKYVVLWEMLGQMTRQELAFYPAEDLWHRLDIIVALPMLTCNDTGCPLMWHMEYVPDSPFMWRLVDI